MTYDDTKFTNMMKVYGIKRIIFSLDFELALILTILFALSVSYFNIAGKFGTGIFTTYATISSGMIAIVIASLAIIVSVSDNDFISFISQSQKIYHNILFTFWYSSIIAGISVAVNIGSYFLMIANPNQTVITLILLMSIATFLTSYAVFIVVKAIGTVMRFGLYRAEYAKIKKSK